MANEKLKNTFFNKFPAIILSNEIVASILFVVSEKIALLKNEIDNELNTDI